MEVKNALIVLETRTKAMRQQGPTQERGTT